MPIVGTAGHVDHGKSTLIHVLTGIDPDRLEEEKRRGMTIDLGFAHLDLPSGERVGIVDVPGHARFLHNMLAGVHGMDAVLLVVAADEGVMPQTREHLDILQLLGVRQVVVALTKVDLVEPALIGLAEEEVRAELGRRDIRAVVVPVSAPSRIGLDQLVIALTAIVGEAHPLDRGRPRLPVDRSFTMPGFGTVVTGSLVDGVIRVGQELELVPNPGGRGRAVRVRGLQQHGRKVEEARPGSRVAVNLQGVDHDQVRRGQVLAPPGTLGVTTRLDARIRVLAGSPPLRHNARVRVHAGTAETAARVVLLEGDELAPGNSGWVQLRLAGALALRDGDRMVLRRLSPAQTLGGGEVVDRAAPPHRRSSAARVIAGLARRSQHRGRVQEDLARERSGTSTALAARRLDLDETEVAEVLAQLVSAGDAVRLGGVFLDAERWAAIVGRARQELEAYHRRNPLRPGMPVEELRRPLGLDAKLTSDVTTALVEQGVVASPGRGLVGLAGWEPRLTAAQRTATEGILATLAATPLAPPRLSELGPGAGALCQHLEEQGEVVRIAPDLFLLPAAIDSAREALVRHLDSGTALTVADARDVLGSSRKVVVPLLEYFDAEHLTVRDGDLRRLRRPSTGRRSP
ncbi:MAG: selenocysteine-specific elongation factor [Chloroflexota bacterium]|nr:selenocysteine-specific elongation factor [Chloroflexota bacterium]